MKYVYRHRKKAHNYFARPVTEILAAANVADVAGPSDTADTEFSVPKTCKICDTKISTSRHFHDHMKTHVDKDSYICNICGGRYKLAKMLKVNQIDLFLLMSQ